MQQYEFNRNGRDPFCVLGILAGELMNQRAGPVPTRPSLDAARRKWAALVEVNQGTLAGRVAELHRPDNDDGTVVCSGCDAGDFAEFSPEWPCRTIDLMTME